jgi:hypothetical protein
MLRTDHLLGTHVQNRSSTGNTCSEQSIYRKHILLTDHLQETHAKNRSSTGNTCLERIINDHLQETHGQGRIIYCADHQQEKNYQKQIIKRSQNTDHL